MERSDRSDVFHAFKVCTATKGLAVAFGVMLDWAEAGFRERIAEDLFDEAFPLPEDAIDAIDWTKVPQ